MSGFHTRSGRSVGESLKKFAAAVEQNVGKALDAAAASGLEAVRETLSRPGSPNNPAMPGHAPHRVTGQLRDSATVETPRENVRRISVGGPDAPYAISLELGTRSGGIHPFLRPSVERARQQMMQRFKDTLKKGST